MFSRMLIQALGPPLHISMNPSVTPVQVHSRRCPVAGEPKVAEAIRDMEKQDILKKFTDPIAWISNSVYRENPYGSLRALPFREVWGQKSISEGNTKC